MEGKANVFNFKFSSGFDLHIRLEQVYSIISFIWTVPRNT